MRQSAPGPTAPPRYVRVVFFVKRPFGQEFTVIDVFSVSRQEGCEDLAGDSVWK